jgi:hypothetical protein
LSQFEKNQLIKKLTLFSLGPGPFPFFPGRPTFSTRGPRLPPRSHVLSRPAAGPHLPPRHIDRTPPPSLFPLAHVAPNPYFQHSFTPVQTPPSASPPPHRPSPSRPPGQVWARRRLPPHHPDAVQRPLAREVPIHRRICADEPPPPRITSRRRSVRCTASSPCPACSPLLTHACVASATAPRRPVRHCELHHRVCCGRGDYAQRVPCAHTRPARCVGPAISIACPTGGRCDLPR